MNILVGGGLGFKGINFIMSLLDKYPDCFIVNIDMKGKKSNIKFQYLGDYYKNYIFINGNIGNKDLVNKILNEYNIDIVVNFAEESVRNSREINSMFKNNIEELYNFIEECRMFGVQRFLNISSADVYDGDIKGEIDEEGKLSPKNFYAMSKAQADILCSTFYNTYGFPIIVVRVGEVFGPYQYKDEFIPYVIINALKNNKISLYGDGLDIKQWIYIKDMVEALDKIMNIGRPGQIYNLSGNERKRSIEIVEQILDYLEMDIKLIYYREERLDFTRRRILDTKKIRKEVFWREKYTFDKSLKDTIEWYSNEIQNNK